MDKKTENILLKYLKTNPHINGITSNKWMKFYDFILNYQLNNFGINFVLNVAKRVKFTEEEYKLFESYLLLKYILD